MLSRDANIVGGRVKSVYQDSNGTGTKEEEDRLKQMKINMETARRQGDQDTVKEIKEAIEELAASIKFATTKDGVVNKNSDMYEKGKQCAISFTYIPDFKNDQEKIDFEAGLKQGYQDNGKTQDTKDSVKEEYKGWTIISGLNNFVLGKNADGSDTVRGDDIAEVKSKIDKIVTKTKDDQSDAYRVKIEHLKEAIKQYPDDPKNSERRNEIKELEAKITKGTSDAGLLTCKHCKSTFASDNVISHMKKFNKDRYFMTTKHCPNCDKRISLRDENPDVEAANKRIVLLNKYGSQCRMNGEWKEYDKALGEIKELAIMIANIKVKQGHV